MRHLYAGFSWLAYSCKALFATPQLILLVVGLMLFYSIPLLGPALTCGVSMTFGIMAARNQRLTTQVFSGRMGDLIKWSVIGSLVYVVVSALASLLIFDICRVIVPVVWALFSLYIIATHRFDSLDCLKRIWRQIVQKRTAFIIIVVVICSLGLIKHALLSAIIAHSFDSFNLLLDEVSHQHAPMAYSIIYLANTQLIVESITSLVGSHIVESALSAIIMMISTHMLGWWYADALDDFALHPPVQG